MLDPTIARKLDQETLSVRQATEKFGDCSLRWIPLLRKAFGLSLRQLGKRIGVSGDAIHKLEKSERENTITVKSLRKVARTMGCRVVVVVLPPPNTSFGEIAAEFDPEIRALLDKNTRESLAKCYQIRRKRYGVYSNIFASHVPVAPQENDSGCLTAWHLAEGE